MKKTLAGIVLLLFIVASVKSFGQIQLQTSFNYQAILSSLKRKDISFI